MMATENQEEHCSPVSRLKGPFSISSADPLSKSADSVGVSSKSAVHSDPSSGSADSGNLFSELTESVCLSSNSADITCVPSESAESLCIPSVSTCVSSESADSINISSDSTKATSLLKIKRQKKRQKGKEVDSDFVSPKKKVMLKDTAGSLLAQARMGKTNRKRKKHHGNDMDGDNVPSKKKVKLKMTRDSSLSETCLTSEEKDNGDWSVWSELGVLKCQKCGFTTTEHALFNCHICGKKRLPTNSPPKYASTIKTSRASTSIDSGPALSVTTSDIIPGSSQPEVCSVMPMTFIIKTSCAFTSIVSEPELTVTPSAIQPRSSQPKVCSAVPVTTLPVFVTSEGGANLLVHSVTSDIAPSSPVTSSSKPNAEKQQVVSSQVTDQSGSDPQAVIENELKQGYILYDEKTKCFVCMQCQYSAVEGKSLIEHLMYQVTANPYNCLHCKKGFPSRAVFQKHFTEQHKGKRVECKLHHVKAVKEILREAKEAAKTGKPQSFHLHSAFKACITRSTVAVKVLKPSPITETQVSENTTTATLPSQKTPQESNCAFSSDPEVAKSAAEEGSCNSDEPKSDCKDQSTCKHDELQSASKENEKANAQSDKSNIPIHQVSDGTADAGDQEPDHTETDAVVSRNQISESSEKGDDTPVIIACQGNYLEYGDSAEDLNLRQREALCTREGHNGEASSSACLSQSEDFCPPAVHSYTFSVADRGSGAVNYAVLTSEDVTTEGNDKSALETDTIDISAAKSQTLCLSSGSCPADEQPVSIYSHASVSLSGSEAGTSTCDVMSVHFQSDPIVPSVPVPSGSLSVVPSQVHGGADALLQSQTLHSSIFHSKKSNPLYDDLSTSTTKNLPLSAQTITNEQDFQVVNESEISSLHNHTITLREPQQRGLMDHHMPAEAALWFSPATEGSRQITSVHNLYISDHQTRTGSDSIQNCQQSSSASWQHQRSQQFVLPDLDRFLLANQPTNHETRITGSQSSIRTNTPHNSVESSHVMQNSAIQNYQYPDGTVINVLQSGTNQLCDHAVENNRPDTVTQAPLDTEISRSGENLQRTDSVHASPQLLGGTEREIDTERPCSPISPPLMNMFQSGTSQVCDHAMENTLSTPVSQAPLTITESRGNLQKTDTALNSPQLLTAGMEKEINTGPYSPISPPACRSPVYIPISPASPSSVRSPVCSPLSLPVTSAESLQPLDLLLTQQGDHFDATEEAGHASICEVTADSSMALASKTTDRTSTDVDCETGHKSDPVSSPMTTEENKIQSSSATPVCTPSAPQALGDDNLCKSFFVKFFNTFACFLCSKRFKDKETFSHHVWDHLHSEAQQCSGCCNTARDSCLKTREMVDSVSSSMDQNLLLKLSDDCRNKLLSKLVGRDSSAPQRSEGDLVESPISTTYLHAQASCTGPGSDVETTENVQSESTETAYKPEVSLICCPSVPKDTSSNSEINPGTEQSQVSTEARDYTKQVSIHSPLPCISEENNVDEESSISREQTLVNQAGGQEDSGSHTVQAVQEVHPEDCSSNISATSPYNTVTISENTVQSEKTNCPEINSDALRGDGEPSPSEKRCAVSLDNGDHYETEESELQDVNEITEKGQEEPRVYNARSLSMGSGYNRDSSPNRESERPQSAEPARRETLDRSSNFYICGLCTFSCDTAIDFTVHLNCDHHDESSFPCYHCNYSGQYTTDLTNHFNAHTTENPNIYLCPCFLERCSFRTDNLNDLHQHMGKNHKDCSSFKCDRCESTFTDGLEFLQHARQNSITLYTCTRCASRVLEKTAFQQHWRTKHSGGRMYRVLKTLLCRDRKVNGYQYSCDKLTKNNIQEKSYNDSTPTPASLVPNTASTAFDSNGKCAVYVQKPVTVSQVLSARSPSRVSESETLDPVINTESKVPGLENHSERPSHAQEMAEDAVLANVDKAHSGNFLESSGHTVDPSCLPCQDVAVDPRCLPSQDEATVTSSERLEPITKAEDSRSEVLTSENDELDSIRIVEVYTVNESESKNCLLEQNGSQVVPIEGHNDSHLQASASPGHQHLEEENESGGMNSPSPCVVTQVQGDIVPAAFSDTAACETQVSNHVSQTVALSSELPNNGIPLIKSSEPSSRGVPLSATDTSGAAVTSRGRMVKLTELFGSEELHKAMTNYLYCEKDGQFSCSVCDRVFDLCKHIHEHLFTHFYVPLFSCLFCSYESLLQKDLKRHASEKHPEQKIHIRFLMVNRNHLLETLEREKPLTLEKFRNICQDLKDGNKRTHRDIASGGTVGRDSNSVATKEAGPVTNTDVKNASTSMRCHASVVCRDHGSKKNHSCDKTVPADRTEKSFDDSEDFVNKPSDEEAHGVVESLTTSVLIHHRENSEEKSRDSVGKELDIAAKNSKKIHMLAAKPHSSAQYMRRFSQNWKGKEKSPARPKSGTYTVVKIGATSKLKCKACNNMTLSPSAMSRHQETCKPFINPQSVSEQMGFAGSLARKMRTKGSAVGSFSTLSDSETFPEEPESSLGHMLDTVSSDSSSLTFEKKGKKLPSKHVESDKAVKCSSQKSKNVKTLYKHAVKGTDNFEKKAQRQPSKENKTVGEILCSSSEKSSHVEMLPENSFKETDDTESLCDTTSAGSDGNKTETINLKDVKDNCISVESDGTSVENSHVCTNSAADQNENEMSDEDDILVRRKRKRRMVSVLDSSDEDEVKEDGSLEMAKTIENVVDLEQIFQCKHCDFTAPSSHKSELQEHLHNKHQRLLGLTKCGYCGSPYGNVEILKRHIKRIHPGKPDLKEQVPYHEFFRIQEKENCSPKQQSKMISKIRLQPKLNQKKMQKISDPIIIEDDLETEKSADTDEGNVNKKPVNSLLLFTVPDTSKEKESEMESMTPFRKAISLPEINSPVKTAPRQARISTSSSLEGGDLGHGSVADPQKDQKHPRQKVKKFSGSDSEEFRTSLTSESTQGPQHVDIESITKDDNKMRFDTSSKGVFSVSEGKDSAIPVASIAADPASALKSKSEGDLAVEQPMDDGKDNKRYRCVKCPQELSDHRSIFLHLSRHLDYSPLRCGSCHMEFVTTSEVQLHYSSEHPGKPFIETWVCDADKEEELNALIKASLVKEAENKQACEQELSRKHAEQFKQSIQCSLCKTVMDSLNLFRSHCLEHHGIENNIDKMHWIDISSQNVYDLGGKLVHHGPDSLFSVYSYLCGFCCWRFRNRDASLVHMTKMHSEMKCPWTILLHCVQPTSQKPVTATSSEAKMVRP